MTEYYSCGYCYLRPALHIILEALVNQQLYKMIIHSNIMESYELFFLGINKTYCRQNEKRLMLKDTMTIEREEKQNY